LLCRTCGIREYLVDTLGKMEFTIDLSCLSYRAEGNLSMYDSPELKHL
jgi:hypothetical protein